MREAGIGEGCEGGREEVDKGVAIKTPVPKCWQRKMMLRCRLLPVVRRLEKRGKPHAKVLRVRIRNRAKTWMPVS